MRKFLNAANFEFVLHFLIRYSIIPYFVISYFVISKNLKHRIRNKKCKSLFNLHPVNGNACIGTNHATIGAADAFFGVFHV